MPPSHARPLSEEASGYQDLEKGIWFRCHCGRIGHISELLATNDSTQMWCPQCRQDDWSWANNGVTKTA